MHNSYRQKLYCGARKSVGHGIINKAIQAVYYKKSTREIERMMNAEVRVLEL